MKILLIAGEEKVEFSACDTSECTTGLIEMGRH